MINIVNLKHVADVVKNEEVEMTAVQKFDKEMEQMKDKTDAEQRAFLELLKAHMAAMESKPVSTLKKNQKPSKSHSDRKYVLLSRRLEMWGKVPQQQVDIADLLVRNMVVGDEYSEQEVFAMLVDHSGEYNSLVKSTQDPTYLFRYYRGLKNDGKYAGFIARKFIRQIG